jgi:hypothetical protein
VDVWEKEGQRAREGCSGGVESNGLRYETVHERYLMYKWLRERF